MVAVALSPDGHGRRGPLDDLRSVVDRRRARLALLETARLPANDKFAQLTRGALDARAWSSTCRPASTSSKPIVVRWARRCPDRALITRTLVASAPGRTASVVEELVVGARDAPMPTPARRSSRARPRSSLGDGRVASRSPASRSCPTNVVAIQHRAAEIGEDATLQWALAQLGGGSSAAAVDNRLVGDRSSVEQVEIVFGGDEQLFDLTSYTTHIGRDTTGDLLSKGALLDQARTYLKGLITIEKTAIGTDSFLGEFGMNLSKQARSVAIPSASRSTSPTAGARCTARRSARSTRRSSSTSSRAASRRTRRASSSCSASSSRSWRACRWLGPGAPARRCSRPSGPPGTAA